MSGALQPITLQSLMGPTPPAATTPGGAFNPLLQFAASAVRSGTSEMVGLEGDWVTGLTGISPEETAAWRDRNFWTGIGSQIAGAIPGYAVSAAVTGPIAAAPAVARVAPWAARAFTAEQMAAAPVRALATQGVLTTIPISAARLAATPVMGGDLERVASSVGIDLAGGALMGAGFGLFRGLRGGQVADDFERQLARQIPDYNPEAPVQERLSTLLDARQNFDGQPIAPIMERTIEGLRQSARIENAPSLLGRRNWLGPLEGEDATSEAGMRSLRMDIGRLFRPTPEATETGAERALRVQTLSRGQTGFRTSDEWRAVVDEVGLPADWERNLQYPRVVTANATESARVSANIRRHLGESVGDGWHIRREADQDLFLVARELPGAGDSRRWFIARTNAPERLLPLPGSLRRGDKLARFVGQAEENMFQRAVEGLPEGDLVRMAHEGTKNRPVGLRAAKPKWDLMEHFPAPLQNAATSAQPLASEVWRRFKSVAAPTQSRFKDRPLAQWIAGQAKSIYEIAQGKAARALHGARPTNVSPMRQIMTGLPDQGGLRKMFDGLKEGDAALVQRYVSVREAGKLSLDDAIRATFNDVDNETFKRVEPLIREWDRIANDAFSELQRTARVTGTPVPKEVEGWALPHTWVGDWRQRVFTEDKKVHIVGGRTREEALRNAEQWVEQNGGRLQARGPFQTDRDGDFDLVRELGTRRLYPDERVGVSVPSNAKNRKATPTGGFVGDAGGPTLKNEELWEIMSSDIELKYRDIAQRTVHRIMGQSLLPEVRAKYGVNTATELAQVLRTMRGEQGTFSRWQNQAMSFLDPLLGKNSASKIAASWNAAEAHWAFGFGNLAFPAGNAVTFLQTVAPKMALMRQVGLREGSERAFQLFDFMPSFNSQGVPDGAFASISPMKLAKAAMQDMVNPTPKQQQMFNRAVEEGVVAARIKDEYLGQKSRIGRNVREAMDGNEPVTNLVKAAAGVNMAIPHRVEELTRAHTFFTWMRTGELLGLTDDAMYEFAKRGTWQTMYGYAQADRPRMFTGPIGMMAGLFKNWLFNYVADMGMYSREALRGNYSGLLWALGSSTALAGIGGLPLYGVLDQMSKMISDKPLVENLFGAVENTTTADALYYGVPGLMGVSLQGMMAAPFNDFGRDLSFMFNAVALDRARKIGQVGGAVWDRWTAGGENPLTQDRTWDQLAFALGPRTLYRLFAQVEDGALMSIRNGRPIVEGITPIERGMNAVGFTSTNIARAWEASESLWRDQEKRRALTSQFSEAYHQAMVAGQGQAMSEILNRAIASGADVSSVMRGVVERQRNQVLPQVPYDYLRQPGAWERLQTLRVGQ